MAGKHVYRRPSAARKLWLASGTMPDVVAARDEDIVTGTRNVRASRPKPRLFAGRFPVEVRSI